MSITFIHTSDWHLAKPFGRFDDVDAEKAPLLREARQRIPERIAALARAQGAQQILVAGDIFDSDLVDNAVLRRLRAELERHDDLHWHFLPGNHDRSVTNGVWQRFQAVAPAGTVTIHHEAGCHTLADGVDLLTAPLHARQVAHDPTAWMDTRDSAPGVIRIGLAHGSVHGFGSSGEAAVPLAADRADRARLDYLALGDWHGARQAGPRAWYAGTPEPDRFLDNDPGFALAVTIAAAGSEPEVTRHRTATYTWLRRDLDGDLSADLGALETELGAGQSDETRTLLQVGFEGHVTVEQELDLRDRIDRLGDRLFWAEGDFSALRIHVEDALLAFDDPLIATAAQRLASIAGAEADEAAVAHQALVMLASYVRDLNPSREG